MHTFDQEVAAQYGANLNTIVVHQPEIFHSEYEKPAQHYARVITLP